MNRTARTAAIAALTALAAVAAIITADFTPPVQAQSEDDSGRIIARLRSNGKTEFGWQQPTNQGWGRRVLPQRRNFPVPAKATVGEWLQSSPVEVEGVELGLIEVRLLADGRLEFAFLRTTGERILPQRRYFPADARVGEWLPSTEIAIKLSDSENLHQQIAERFAPVLRFERDEQYFPVPVELMIRYSTLHYTRNGQAHERAPGTYGLTHLISHIGEDSYLDLADWRRGEKGDRVVYARVAETYGAEAGVLVQYWFFYLYNETGLEATNHEGDWEGIQYWFADLSPNDLLTAYVPTQIGFAAHESGWAYHQIPEDCTNQRAAQVAVHPHVYVARNRHASYIEPGSGGDLDKSKPIWSRDQFQGNGAVWTLQGREHEGELDYEIRLLPEPVGRYGQSWLGWDGRWGDTGGISTNDGPKGPSANSHFWRLPAKNKGWSTGTFYCAGG